MKRNPSRTSSRLKVVIAVAGFIGWACQLHATFSLGDAGNYAVMYEGNGGQQLQINNGPGPGGLAVNGDIGIGGTGRLQLSGPLIINGDVNFSSLTANDNGPYSGNIVLNGSINANQSSVSSDLTYLNNLSSSLGGESGTSVTIGGMTSQTIDASSGTLDANGNRVFSVTSFSSFTTGDTLIINGTANQFVVINVPDAGGINAQFDGSIKLTGGITANQVLFNILGGMALTGGQTLAFSANGNTESGTFLDPNGDISLNSVVINGHVYGGDTHDYAIVSGAEINVTPVPEPTTIIGSAMLLFPLGASLLKIGARRGMA